MINNRPEILAPCGNIEAYFAAEHAGADAVYLAGKMFGARAYAGNFSEDELLKVLESAHIHGVRVYLTLNTLLKEQETEYLYEYLKPFYEAGLDGILVQDFGVLKMVKEMFPLLPIHTSTQMNVCSTYGARLAKEMGAVRVVPARELSLDELKKIKEEVGIEVEAFVHGAMCFSYSGRCLFSAMMGGRSGNRGRCAQPCRQKFGDNYPISMKDMCTLHSVPDLMKAGIDSLKIEGRMKSTYYVASCIEAYRNLEEDVLAGCFTHEKADYYQKRLAEIFNRGMFSKGYLFQHHGEEMLDVMTPGRQGVAVGKVLGTKDGQVRIDVSETIHKQDILGVRNALKYSDDPVVFTSGKIVEAGSVSEFAAPRTKDIHKDDTVYRLQNTVLQEEIENTLIKPVRRMPIDITVSMFFGSPIEISFEMNTKDKKVRTKMVGKVVDYSDSGKDQEEFVRDKIGQLGNTDFILNRFIFHSDGCGFVPASELKKLRRDGIEKLKEQCVKSFSRKTPDISSFEDDSCITNGDKDLDLITSCNANDKLQHKRYIRVPNNRILTSVLDTIQEKTDENIDEKTDTVIIYYCLGGQLNIEAIKKSIARIKDHGHKAYFEMPKIYRDSMGEEVISSILDILRACDGVVLTNIDTLQIYKEFVIDKQIQPLDVILDYSLYSYNRKAIQFYWELMKKYSRRVAFIASEEISKTERERLYKDVKSVIIPQYEKVELMITAQRLHYDELRKDKQRFLVYHNEAFSYDMIKYSKAFQKNDSEADDISWKLYSFTNEDRNEIFRILSDESIEFTDEMRYFRGIE